MHVGPGDAAGVAGEADRHVHLRQLRQALGAEGGVEQAPARADVEHLGAVANDDERAHVRLEDAVDALAQRRSGCHRSESRTELPARPTRHVAIVVRGGARAVVPTVVLCAPWVLGGRQSVAASTSRTRASASAIVWGRATRMASGGGGAERGTTACVKPRRSASASRRSVRLTWRSSPPSP